MPTHSTLGRRYTTATSAALVSLLALTACASADTTDASAETAESASLLPVSEGATTYPVTLETPWGETVLEERPERIVALGPTDAELLAAIGVTPVGTQSTLERAVWVQDALPQEIEDVYDWDTVLGDIGYEDVAASEPDLIIWTGSDLSAHYEQLSAIAPVLGAETDAQATTKDWRTEIQTVGEALDLADAATTATEDYDEFFEQARADNPEFEGLTTSYVIHYGEEYGTVYSSVTGSDVEQLFLDLGFAPNPLAEQFVENGSVSDELISQIDADVLIVGSVVSGDNKEAVTEELLTGKELFQQLGAVQSGQWAITYATDGSGYVFDGVEHEGNVAWALAHGGALLGKQWAAEQFIPLLRSALNVD